MLDEREMMIMISISSMAGEEIDIFCWQKKNVKGGKSRQSMMEDKGRENSQRIKGPFIGGGLIFYAALFTIELEDVRHLLSVHTLL